MVKYNFSLKSLNTFGLNVSAAAYVRINDVAMFEKLPKNLPLPYFFLGGGSNILFTKNFPGTVLHIDIRGRGVESSDENQSIVYSYAGENWHEFVRYTLQLNLGGLENLSLIPGNVGTAPVQNIGAYGVEIKDVLFGLEAWDLNTGQLLNFRPEDCEFDYRTSIFKKEGKNRYIITKVYFRLDKNPSIKTSYGAIQDELKKLNIENPDIHDVSRAVIRIRMSKLPDPNVLGNCGSFFKNPLIEIAQAESLATEFPDIPIYPTGNDHLRKVSAGWLIEKCGWKGKVIGQVAMHEKQALVLTNLGNANGEELRQHALRVKKSVFEKFNIQLEEEVNIL